MQLRLNPCRLNGVIHPNRIVPRRVEARLGVFQHRQAIALAGRVGWGILALEGQRLWQVREGEQANPIGTQVPPQAGVGAKPLRRLARQAADQLAAAARSPGATTPVSPRSRPPDRRPGRIGAPSTSRVGGSPGG